MKKLIAALLFAAAPAAAQFCPSCIQNSASAQNAQFNVTSATIRGSLTVGQITISTISASTVTAGVFIGSGTFLTNLNASQLLLGIVPGAVMAGPYSGITGVGTIATGLWRGSPVAIQYGGTGQNLSGAGAGSIPYFNGTTAMAALPSPATYGILASTGTGGTPVWVSSPALTGQHFSAIPLTALTPGALPMNIAVNDASISTVSAAKVVGNIAGGASFLTIALPVSNLAGGTLPTSNAASSVTAIVGLQPGTFGGPTTLAQFKVGYDGRISTAAQFNLPATGVSTGVVTNATLTGNGQSFAPLAVVFVPTSGVNLSTVTTALAAKAASGANADITSLSALTTISHAVTQSGALTNTSASGVTATSSITASAFFGDGSHLTGVQATGVPSTFVSSITFLAGALVNNSALTLSGSQGFITGGSSVIAGGFFGDGSHLGGIPSTGAIVATYLPFFGGTMTGLLSMSNAPIQASGSNGYITSVSSVNASAFFGDGSHLSGLINSIPNTVFSSFTVVNNGGILSSSSMTAKAFFGDGSHLTGITATSIPNTISSSFTVVGSGGLLLKNGGATVNTGNLQFLTGSDQIQWNAGAQNITTDLSGNLQFNVTGATTVVTGPSGLNVLFGIRAASVTATEYYGDGSNLTGVVATPGNTVISSFTVKGAGGLLVVGSSVTASAFFGDGSHLNGVIATPGNTVQSSFTITGAGGLLVAGDSVTANAFFGDGTALSNTNLLLDGSGDFIAFPGNTNTTDGAGNSTIAGGNNNSTVGNNEFIGGGSNNSANGNYNSIPGGFFNSSAGGHNNINGGQFNSILAGSDSSSIDGGNSNGITGSNSAILGGDSNTIGAADGAVLGGSNNTVTGDHGVAAGENADADHAHTFVWSDGSGSPETTSGPNQFRLKATGGFYVDGGSATVTSSMTASAFFGDGSHLLNIPCEIGGASASVVCQGLSNSAASFGDVVSGGQGNSAGANYTTIIGGLNNTANAAYGVVLGGSANIAAGDHSIAAGENAQPSHANTFVWSDGTGSPAATSGPNQFRIKSTGGFYIDSGYANVSSSVNASAFFGDGSHLTGVTASAGNTVTSSFTVTGAGGILVVGDSVTASAFFGDGSHLTGISGGGASSPLATYNGTSTIPGVRISSPTSGINFDSSAMTVTLQGTATAFVTLNATQSLIKNLSGLTTISNPYTATSSMTNTSGGGILVSNGIKAATGTFTGTGAATFSVSLSSSLSFANGTTGIGIHWADGTVSTTASSGGGAGGITALTGGVTASGSGSVVATVVTNANLTGPVTSVGNATTIVGPVPQAAVNLSTVTTQFNSVAVATTAIVASFSALASTGTSIAFSTVQITQNGATPLIYPNTPLLQTGNINGYFQDMLQNRSSGSSASSNRCVTSDQGTDSSIYACFGINSSNNNGSVDGFTAWPSSAAYSYSSDGPMVLWSGTNGGANGSTNGYLQFGSSMPVSANTAGYLLPATSAGPGAWVFMSSVTVNAAIKATSYTGRVIKRVVTASDATSITPNTDNADITYQSNSQALGTLTINADAGTPTNGQAWLLKIKSTNVQTFSWNGVYVGGTAGLPTVTTGGGKIDNYAFIWDSVNGAWEFTGSAGGF